MKNKGRGTVEGQQLRRNRITRIASEQGAVSVIALAEEFGVSAMTIYRDVAALEELRLVNLVKGDVHASTTARSEASAIFRMEQNKGAKEVIARKAAAMVPVGSSIIVDDSTTCLYLLDELLEQGPYNVITNSLLAARRVSQSPDARLQILGGEYEKWADSLTGSPVHNAIRALSVDFCFLSASGVLKGGCYHPYLSMASIKSDMISVAETSMLLVDHTKFDRRGVHKFADLADFQVVLTDGGISEEKKIQLQELGNLQIAS